MYDDIRNIINICGTSLKTANRTKELIFMSLKSIKAKNAKHNKTNKK